MCAQYFRFCPTSTLHLENYALPLDVMVSTLVSIDQLEMNSEYNFER